MQFFDLHESSSECKRKLHCLSRNIRLRERERGFCRLTNKGGQSDWQEFAGVAGHNGVASTDLYMYRLTHKPSRKYTIQIKHSIRCKNDRIIISNYIQHCNKIYIYIYKRYNITELPDRAVRWPTRVHYSAPLQTLREYTVRHSSVEHSSSPGDEPTISWTRFVTAVTNPVRHSRFVTVMTNRSSSLK